ncbi:Ran-specific GTPase-activating protein 30 [Parahypoxylon ruwenzoriense]
MLFAYVLYPRISITRTVDDDPLRTELSHLQRRLARKIELISPILESIEFRYTRGNSALETVVRTSQELRANVDSLGKRLEAAALADHSHQDGGVKSSAAAQRRIEIQNIIGEIKQLIVDIDDSIPLINLWVSAIGGIQTQTSAFSPSRLLQASMLVNVGDTQYILDPARPMQIGPDFTLSLYMLFGAHASSEDSGEPYGVEDGQRKPVWQEVIHKARVRLYRMPFNDDFPGMNGIQNNGPHATYAYQLQIVEDLDDGRVHTLDDSHTRPGPYDGVPLAGIREFIPVGQVSKMFYADVGRILNINNEEGASSNPVLLLKRDIKATPPNRRPAASGDHFDQPHLIEVADESAATSDSTLSEGNSQDEVDYQLRREIKATATTQSACTITQSGKPQPIKTAKLWRLPQDLDPEWIALEVFEMDGSDAGDDTTDEEDNLPSEEDQSEGNLSSPTLHPRHPKRITQRPYADSNLITQLNRMSIVSRPSSRNSEVYPDPKNPDNSRSSLLERSPFGAIRTSLSLLEMLLRLTSLQEFEQTTHLAIPDDVLRFYLDESTSRADAEAAPVHHRGAMGRG